MLYYRRKLLLAILEVFRGKLSAIQLQKYLFLITRQQNEKSFHFVPFKYGCFSFQANQDLSTLSTYGYINITNNEYSLNDSARGYFKELRLSDQRSIQNIFTKFGTLSQDELIIYIYKNFPFFAINSNIAEKILDHDSILKIEAQRHKKNEKQLFTIGYEGISLEEYINKLIVEDIRVLCDVRKNAYSQKYGFSKSQLTKACEGVGIKYIHFPELGIDSEKRNSLMKQNDYDLLFLEYEKSTLNSNSKVLEELLNLITIHKRIALTCFEKEPNKCHRTRIAKALTKISNNDFYLNQIIF